MLILLPLKNNSVTTGFNFLLASTSAITILPISILDVLLS